RVLYLLDPLADELRLDRFAVGLFQDRVHGRLVGRRDLLDDRPRVLVPRVDSVEVQHRDAAELAHGDRELDVDHAVHRRTPEGKLELELFAIAQREGDVDLVRVERHAARDEGDLVEAIGAARAPANAYLESELLRRKGLSGC